MTKELATVLALIIVCLISYALVGLRDRADKKASGRQEKYTRSARKLAKEFREANRDATAKTESEIALPSIAYWGVSGIIVAIAAEFVMDSRMDSILYWLNNRFVDPFGADFVYAKPIITVTCVLLAFWFASTLTIFVAEVHARRIAEKRLRKGRTVCFAQRRSVMEAVEGLAARVAAPVAQLVDRRKGEDAESEEEPVAAR